MQFLLLLQSVSLHPYSCFKFISEDSFGSSNKYLEMWYFLLDSDNILLFLVFFLNQKSLYYVTLFLEIWHFKTFIFLWYLYWIFLQNVVCNLVVFLLGVLNWKSHVCLERMLVWGVIHAHQFKLANWVLQIPWMLTCLMFTWFIWYEKVMKTPRYMYTLFILPFKLITLSLPTLIPR